jgi:three-Cys-motif partner protein
VAPRLDDDGLYLPEVGAWGERKYGLIAAYAAMFSTAMKGKWSLRAYVDLFAGAGRARLKDSTAIVPTSAMLALTVPRPFDRYVFCDAEEDCIEALRRRVERHAPGRDARFLFGDCNGLVDRVAIEVPRSKSLTFCVVDPCRMAHLQFSTIKGLARDRRIDFLVLIPSHMDAHRNLTPYLDPSNHTVAEFLGSPEWRRDWAEFERRGGKSREFGVFVVDQFGQSMKRLGFLYDGPSDTVPVRDKSLLLYHLAFFSRHALGQKFWREARRSSSYQLGLWT